MNEAFTGVNGDLVSAPDAGAQERGTEADALAAFISEPDADAQAQAQAGTQAGADAGDGTSGASAQEDAQETRANEDGAKDGEADAAKDGEADAPVAKGLKGRLQAAEAKADKRGYERGLQEARAAWEAEKRGYEERIAKYAEFELERDAKELAAKERCSVELAKRLLRLERGLPDGAKAAPVAAPNAGRGAKGAPSENAAPSKTAAPDAQARALELYEQAQSVQARTGVDVLKLFSENEEIKRRVASGEWDFKDVALARLAASGTQAESAQAAPRPVRATGAQPVRALDFDTMTDAEFEAFERKIAQGRVFRLG